MPARVPTGPVGTTGSNPSGWTQQGFRSRGSRLATTGTLSAINIIDPADLAVSVAGTTATLTWSASQSDGVTGYDVYRRTTPTGVPFVPGVDTPIATNVTSPYADSGLSVASYEWQVFGAIAAWTPASLPSLIGWWDMADAATITSSGSPAKASQLADKSGAARHLVQATGTKQPTTGTRTINGQNVFLFDGSDDNMTATFGTLTDPVTILMVVQADSLAHVAIIPFDANHASNRHQTWTGSTTQWSIYEGGSIGGGAVGSADTNAVQIVSVFTSGGASTMYKNGTSIFSGNVGSSTMTDIMVGASAGANGWEGVIGEMVVMNASISGSDRTAWNAYTLAKFGV